MGLGNTLNILRPPGVATTPVQTGWNEDLVKNLHNVLGEMSQQISATSTVSTSSLSSFDTKAILEAATVPLVVDALQLTGYTTAGDGGAALYKRVGAEPSHALKVQSADGAWWELVPDSHGYINVKQAGAVGDDTANDGQAFIDALSFASLNANVNSNATYGVVVPPSNTPYYLGANTLELKRSVHLVGSGSGQAGGKASVLRWDANITGIIVHDNDTIGATTEALGGPGNLSAAATKIEGLFLKSDGGTIAGVTDSTKGHAIWLRARAVITDIAIDAFPGNGINIVAGAGAGGALEGNANNWSIERVRIASCHMNGIFVDLADVNAGYCIGADCSSNGRWGIYDSSFLGNTYIASHTASNGLSGIGENGAGESSFVSFGSNRYSANVLASEADLVATEPGTDETVWFFISTGGSTSAVPLWVASQSEGTYFHGGPYRTDNANARTVFIGSYSESGQGACQFVIPTIVIGGLLGAVKGNAVIHEDNKIVGGLTFPNHEAGTNAPDRDLTLRINASSNKLLKVIVEGDHPGGLNLAAWDEGNGQIVVEHSDSNQRRPVRFTTNLNTEKLGRDAALVGGKIIFADEGIFLGSGFNARNVSNGIAARTADDRAVGDFEFNRAPSAGEPMGWVCITAHATTPTFMAIYGVADQTSDATQAALTDSTGGSADGTLNAISGSGDDAAINKNFQELHLLLNEIRTTLVGNGSMKGSA